MQSKSSIINDYDKFEDISIGFLAEQLLELVKKLAQARSLNYYAYVILSDPTFPLFLGRLASIS